MRTSVYQAKLNATLVTLGIRIEDEALVGIDFLPPDEPSQAPRAELAEKVCEQLRRYFRDGRFEFDLPIKLSGTPHQLKVWRAMQRIPTGQVVTYGAIAEKIRSSPRAVGRACGDNPIPIVVPCHRVVAKNGTGGFMHNATGAPIDIKRWLLALEAAG